MAKISATRQFKTIFPILEKEFGRRERFRSRPPLEQALASALLKDGKEEASKRAVKRIEREFVDLNEARVCAPDDMDHVLGRAYPAGTGLVVTSTLTAIFNYGQAMNIDGLLALEPAKAKKKLLKLKPMPSRVAGELLFTQLGATKLPAGAGLLRVAKRTGITRKGNIDAQITALRRIVPKASIVRAFHAIETLAERICTADNYKCRACPINDKCPTGVDTLRKLKAGEARELAARVAEEKRVKEQRDLDRRIRARKRAATEKLKKAIAVRSKELKIPVRKKTTRRKAAPKPVGTKMVQASSAEVKPQRKKKKKKRSVAKKKRSSTKKT